MNNSLFASVDGQDDDFFNIISGSQSKKSNQTKLALNEETGDVSSRGDLKIIIAQQSENSQFTPLSYRLPKLPSGKVIEEARESWNTQFAKVAQAFKEGEWVGNVGVALLSNTTGACKLIIYKTKTNVLSTLTINSENAEQLHYQAKYFQFYDNKHIYWSFHILSTKDEEDFSSKLKELNIPVNLTQEVVNVETHEEELSNKNVESSNASQALPISSDIEDKSHSEHESSTELRLKSSTLSKVAKIGQQLPLFKPSVSSSERTDDITPAEISKEKEKVTHLPHLSEAQQHSSNTIISQQLGNSESQLMQMLLTECRTQNTEIRINVSRLDSKLEKVLDELDILKTNGYSGPSINKDDQIIELEEKLLNAKKENRKLKQSLNNCDQRSENSALQEIIQELNTDLSSLGIQQKDIKTSKELLLRVLDKTKSLKLDLEKSKVTINEQSKEVSTLSNKYSDSEELIKILEHQQKDTQTVVENVQKQLDEMTKKCSDLETDLSTQQELNVSQTSVASRETESTIKAIMNHLYSALSQQINSLSMQTIPANDILGIVGKTIRDETLKAIQQLKDKSKTIEN